MTHSLRFGLVALIFLLVAGFPLYSRQMHRFFSSDELRGAFISTESKAALQIKAQDVDGKQRSLADFKGQYLVLYFGYTRCNGICPRSFGELRKLQSLTPELPVIFISLDPRRDIQAALYKFEQAMGGQLIALHSIQPDLSTLTHQLNLGYQYNERTAQTNPDYQFNHPDLAYLLDPAGRLLARYSRPRATDIHHDLNLLKQKEINQ